MTEIWCGRHWNYRVLKHVDKVSASLAYTDNEYIWYAIHGVYYDEEGNLDSCGVEPDILHGDSVDDLREVFYMALKAFDKPVINYDDVGKD